MAAAGTTLATGVASARAGAGVAGQWEAASIGSGQAPAAPQGGRPALGRRDLVTMFGSQVWLRPYAHGFGHTELRALYRWANDPELLMLAGGLPLRLPFDAFRRQFLAQLGRQNGPRQQLFAVLAADGSFIGRAGLFQVGDNGLGPGRVGEVGIVIGERAWWSRGVGREAVQLLARYGFDVLGLASLVLHVYADNERAQRSFAAAGFVPVASLRRFSLDRGSHTEIEMTLEPKDERLVYV